MVAAALVLAAPAAEAQKVNKEALLAKIAKSDADVANAKKGAKASTWINRGKAYYEAAAEPTKSLFANMEAQMMRLTVGEPVSKEQETLGEEGNTKTYEVWVYPYFRAYVLDGKIAAWKLTQRVADGLVETAIESYAKAYELDPKSADRVKAGLKQISDFCSQEGNVNLELGDFKAAADAFGLAYAAQAVPAYGGADPELLYYAGYLETVNGSKDPASFAKGAEYLEKAIEEGYEGEEGLSYYYLFYCYYGQKDADPANLQKAKQTLLTGLDKYPKSQRILDGLMSLYTSEEGLGDPADLISRFDAAIAEDPDNVDMWFGLGRIYAALKNNDECIVAFKKVAELAPDVFDGYFWTGYFYVEKGNAMNEELNNKPWTGKAAYDEEQKVINAVYAEAIPWFEKALEIKPNDLNTVDYLKSISFRLRDEEGMMEKYNKYNELLQQIQAQ
ncbi:Tetratricopeptide repeat protein [Alistipes sp. CHKCI003]|nr:Tetratricopeptide repeat protein [Alistipes sp. CHKCI003]